MIEETVRMSDGITIAAFHWARKLVFPNLYFRVGSRDAHRILSLLLGNTTTDFNGMIFPTGKLVNTSFRSQWNAAYLYNYLHQVNGLNNSNNNSNSSDNF